MWVAKLERRLRRHIRHGWIPVKLRMLTRHVLGHAPSGRTIKRLARLAGGNLRRGRPPTTPRVHKRDLHNLIEATSEGLDALSGNALHFFNHIELEFGLSPRQYLKWVAQLVRRGRGLTFYHLSNGA